MVKGWESQEDFYCRLSHTFSILNHVQNLASAQKDEMDVLQ